jgi:uncharacterized protein with GYD domain
MPRFAVFFTLTPETIKRMIDHPGDRAAVLRASLEQQGGRLESYYWMLGQYDGMVICELPDGKSAASAALAVGSTGAFGRTETHELFSSEEIGPLLEGAKVRAGSYTPPGT